MQISGFSKLSKKNKIAWLIEQYFNKNKNAEQTLHQYWNNDVKLQDLHDGFIENTLSNFYFPYAIAPNFLIDGHTYAVPMVIEESSVVAAASKAAKFWLHKGGFKTQILGTTKIGHIHFMYNGNTQNLISFFRNNRTDILQNIEPFQKNMKQRGGGVLDIDLVDKTHQIPNYYQIAVKFDTVDSMGANFINTILEEIAEILKIKAKVELPENLSVIMSILSNFNPECIVRSQVSCPVEMLITNELSGVEYAQKFITAITIAEKEPYRAVTHNKGIMNGVDAVVIATGNDFRAIEAGVHAYAAHKGYYQSLSHAKIENNIFTFWVDLPITIGTVGGLTGIHPLVKFSLQLLQNPNAKQLMSIIASAGLAQNFAALNSLITSGIQKGHMKMHLNNILTLLEVTPEQKQKAVAYFSDKIVSFSAVKKFLNKE